MNRVKMKNIIVGLMLISSISSYAHDGNGKTHKYKNLEKALEKRFEMPANQLSDGKIQLTDLDYDIDIYDKNAVVEIEIEDSVDLKKWETFNKDSLDQSMKKIALEVKNSVGDKELRVLMTIKLDKTFKDDEVVYSKTF